MYLSACCPHLSRGKKAQTDWKNIKKHTHNIFGPPLSKSMFCSVARDHGVYSPPPSILSFLTAMSAEQPLMAWTRIGSLWCSLTIFRSFAPLGLIAIFTLMQVPSMNPYISAWIAPSSSILALPVLVCNFANWTSAAAREGFSVSILSQYN